MVFKTDNSGDFALTSGLAQAKLSWNAALNTSISVTTQDKTAPIRYYGGTRSQINSLQLFDPVPLENAGLTCYSGLTRSGSYTYKTSGKLGYIITDIEGYIVSDGFGFDEYINIATHEVGYAMGWFGHPSPDHTTWVMYKYVSIDTVLSNDEKRHLAQIYT